MVERHASRRGFLKAAAGVTAGTMIGGRLSAAPADTRIDRQRDDHAGHRARMEHLQGRRRTHLRRRCGVEALHRLPARQAAGVRRRRPRPRRHSLRPLRRRRLAGPRRACAGTELGAEAGDRRHPRPGRRLLRHDLRVHAARGGHGADGLLRPRPAAAGGRHRGAGSWCSRRPPIRSRPTPAPSSTTSPSPITPGARPANGTRCSCRRPPASPVRTTRAGSGASSTSSPPSASRGRPQASSWSTTSRRVPPSGSPSAASTRRTARRGSGPATSTAPRSRSTASTAAKVLADARAGKTATLTLTARFQRDTGRAFVAYLPGRDYGTDKDEQVLLATHYRRDVAHRGEWRPRHARHHVVLQPHAARGAPAHARLLLRLPPLHAGRRAELAAIRLLHDASGEGSGRSWRRSAWSTWAGARPSRPVRAATTTCTRPRRPGMAGSSPACSTSYNNNIWLVEAIARAATDNGWPRVDVKTGFTEPGVNGGLQGLVKSPMNKGRAYRIPGVGLAGDWPGGWTQTFAQIDTEGRAARLRQGLFRPAGRRPLADRGRTDAGAARGDRPRLGRA